MTTDPSAPEPIYPDQREDARGAVRLATPARGPMDPLLAADPSASSAVSTTTGPEAATVPTASEGEE